MRPTLLLVLASTLTACEHSEPFAVEAADPLGPSSSTLPRRLTFNTGPDQTPAATASFVAYSTLDPNRTDRDRCLAYLPVAGGTVLRTSCPGGAVPDSLQDALLQPAPSVTDERVAFIREQAPIGSSSPRTRRLQVASTLDVDHPVVDLNVLFELPDGQRVTGVRELRWSGDGMLRFIAGQDFLVVGSQGRVDTVFRPLTVATVDPQRGTFRALPGTDSAFTHAEAPDGGVWFVRTTDVRQILHLDPAAGTVTIVGAFAIDVSALGVVDRMPVAVGLRPTGEAGVEWLDPTTGAPGGGIALAGRVHGIAGVPGARRIVLDLERAGSRDLWLFALP